MGRLRPGLRGPGAGGRGQGLVEYALILVLASIVVIAVMATMGHQVRSAFQNVIAAMTGTGPG